MRRCGRCGRDVPTAAWTSTGTDHSILVRGPMTVDRVGAVTETDHVRFRATEPCLFVWCSTYEATMRALRPEFTTPHEKDPTHG